MARLAWSRWGSLSIISGAFGIFRRSVAVDVGGFTHGTVGEDYDLVTKMHRHLRDTGKPYAMRYVPEPVCWTEAPETLKVLSIQRRRWERGALEVFFRYKKMFLNPSYGRVGMLGFTNNFLVDVISPLAELIGYLLIPLFLIFGELSLPFFLAYVAMFFVFGIFISVASLVLEEMELRRVPRAWDLVKLAMAAVIENFGYRQLNNFWRIMGWWEFLRKDSGWGEMTRKGPGKTQSTQKTNAPVEK
jgi:cellulose synthase/poly-beta-1,6-N-acetylglucosamine synthase-like glycosyltransferase